MVASQELGGFFGTDLDRPLPVIPLLAFLLILAARSMANADSPRVDQSQVVTEAEKKSAVRDELRGRSFCQVQHSDYGNRRKAVILDLSNGLSLWAQYAQDGHAIRMGDLGRNLQHQRRTP